MRASTSIEVYHKEIKGKTNWQNEIVLQAMKRLGKPSTANTIMEATVWFTKDQKPLKINIVTRVLVDLREKHHKVSFENKKEDKQGGRVVHHHYIIEVGKQATLF
jgi:hypothetical protein